MEFITICAIMASTSPQVGVAASVFLMLMALALATRRGLLALALLGVASLAADRSFAPTSDASLLRPVLVLLIAAGLCTWYRLRRGACL